MTRGDAPRFVEEEPEVYEREDLDAFFKACDAEERLWLRVLPHDRNEGARSYARLLEGHQIFRPHRGCVSQARAELDSKSL